MPSHYRCMKNVYFSCICVDDTSLKGWGMWATHTETNGTLGTLRHFGRCTKVFCELPLPSCGLLTLQNRQNVKSELCGTMSDWLALLSVCGGVKVGYSLLLGHVSNPLTLAWILLPDAFSSNKHTLLPDGRGLWDSATSVKVHRQLGEAFI